MNYKKEISDLKQRVAELERQLNPSYTEEDGETVFGEPMEFSDKITSSLWCVTGIDPERRTIYFWMPKTSNPILLNEETITQIINTFENQIREWI